MAPRKPATMKRTAQLRKAHSHIKATKTRKRRPEVDKLLGVTPVQHNIHVNAPNVDAEALAETIVRQQSATLSRPYEERAGTTRAPDSEAGDDSNTLKLHLDMQAIRQDITSSLSPLEKAGCDLMDAVFAHEGLVTDLTNRLASILKKQAQGIIGHGDRIEIGIPYVDALNKQISRLEKSNTALRDLIGRIAV